MILLILASGSGNRLKHLTRNNPKCLVKINNRPIINFMDQFINKFKKTFVVVGYKSKKIKYNTVAMKIAETLDIKEIIVSPYSELRDAVLSQTDITKKFTDIMQFIQNFLE